MADEDYDSDIKILDLSDLPDIYIPNTFNAESTESSITHNQIILGDKLYVSYYVDGLQVFDISDPENPVRELYYDTSTEEPGPGRYRGAWGVYPFLSSGNILVSDMQNGLFVVDGDVPVVDVDEHELEIEVIVYPNPSVGLFNINLAVFEGQTIKVDILDINGKLIRNEETNNSTFTIDLGKEANGIYSIILSSDKATISKKLVLLK